MYNKVFLIGNLTRDPEVRYTPSGTAIATFDVAVNERYRDRNQEWREETLFIRVDTFQRLAETCSQYLKKGRRVFVEGRLKQDSWEAQDGTKRSRMVVRAQTVKFIDSRPAGTEAGAAAPSQTPRQPPSPPPSPPPQPPPAEAPPDGLPEVDVSESTVEPDENNPSTDDDLPF